MIPNPATLNDSLLALHKSETAETTKNLSVQIASFDLRIMIFKAVRCGVDAALEYPVSLAVMDGASAKCKVYVCICKYINIIGFEK